MLLGVSGLQMLPGAKWRNWDQMWSIYLHCTRVKSSEEKGFSPSLRHCRNADEPICHRRHLWCSSPMVGWTGIGHEVQTLSNVCPIIVQHLSKYRLCPVPVQPCQNSVQCLSSKSRLCPMAVKSTSKLKQLDRHWTWKSNISPDFVQ